MTPEQEQRVRDNHETLKEIEQEVLKDTLRALRGVEGEMPNLTDTARGQLLKFIGEHGFNADITTIPNRDPIRTGLTPEDLEGSEEREW